MAHIDGIQFNSSRRTMDFLKLFSIFITIFIAYSEAFWWNTPTTEAPRTLKQLPVGYFRTYTYQPIVYPGSYSSYSYVGAHQSVASPLLGWPQKQPINNSPPGLSGLNMPPPFPQSGTSTEQKHISPIKHSYPTTTPTTTTAAQEKSSQKMGGIQSTQGTPKPHYESYTQTPYVENKNHQDNAPKYSPPDPLSYLYQAPSSLAQQTQHIQFVPCMCPVTVSVSEVPENRSPSGENDYGDQNDLLNLSEEIH